MANVPDTRPRPPLVLLQSTVLALLYYHPVVMSKVAALTTHVLWSAKRERGHKEKKGQPTDIQLLGKQNFQVSILIHALSRPLTAKRFIHTSQAFTTTDVSYCMYTES